MKKTTYGSVAGLICGIIISAIIGFSVGKVENNFIAKRSGMFDCTGVFDCIGKWDHYHSAWEFNVLVDGLYLIDWEGGAISRVVIGKYEKISDYRYNINPRGNGMIWRIRTGSREIPKMTFIREAWE